VDTHRQPDAGLRHAAIGFAVAVVLHNADHLRRGTSAISGLLQVAGWLGLAISLAAIALVLTGHRLAPLAAIAAGFPLAAGFLAAHWLPTWSSFSDSFLEGGASWLSITASLAEVAGALWLGIAGVAAVRRQGGLAAFAV
jgi:hypothetical protein